MLRILLLNIELEEGEWGGIGKPWAPRVLLSVLLLQVLLGEDGDVGVLDGVKVELVGDAHHCLRLPASTQEDQGHRLPGLDQACCLALQ